MNDRRSSRNVLERVTRTMEKIRHGDERLWRHPLADATVALLARGNLVTVETLIAELERMGNVEQPDVTMRAAASKAAIDRLRQAVLEQD